MRTLARKKAIAVNNKNTLPAQKPRLIRSIYTGLRYIPKPGNKQNIIENIIK